MIIDVNLDKIKDDKYASELFINAKFNKLNLNIFNTSIMNNYYNLILLENESFLNRKIT